MEHLLHFRLQCHDRHRLRHPVDHARNAENPRAALLGYLYRADRTGKIATRGHAIPQLVEVIFQPLLELSDRHAISPGRSSVLFHFQPRTPHQPLGDVVRLDLRLRFTHAIPPSSVDHIRLPGQPRPLAPPPLRYAGTSQLLRASPPARPASVLCSSRISPVGVLPLAAADQRQYRDTPSHVPYESLIRAHAAYMPETIWAVNGCPPDSSRGSLAAPVSISSDLISTRQRQRALTHRSSSRTSPDTIQPRLFPRRSPQRSSANAARGGLEPLPAERLWRASNLHLPYSTALSEAPSLHLPRSCSQQDR